MDNIDKKKSQRGSRRTFEKFDEPDLIKDIDSILNIAKKEGYYIENALNIEELIKHFDSIQLKFVEMHGGLSGSLKNEGDKWIMNINAKHHKNRQRFTMAHELGHFIMHKDKNALFEDTTFFRGAESTAIEYAANEFASSLLMPESEIKRLLKEGIRELGILSEKFKVSPSAMKYRLESLGYKFN